MENHNKEIHKQDSTRLHFNKENVYLRAEKRVKELKGFYIHLFIFIVVKLFLTISKIYRNMENGETFEEAFFDSATFGVFGLWGIILLIHFLTVFGKNLFFGKEWERKKIEKFMQNEENNQWN